MTAMTSSKPYLLRALFEWIVDNGFTPHIVVDAAAVENGLPAPTTQDGRLVLNISPAATRNLELENDSVSFQARFSGVSRELFLPMEAILAIYARENGQGMMFTAAGDDDPDPPERKGKPDRGPRLRVIK